MAYQGLGDGQEWADQNKTTNFGYSNTSGRPVLLQTTLNANGLSAPQDALLYVNDRVLSSTVVVPNGQPVTLKGVIPENAYYNITCEDAVQNVIQWAELTAVTPITNSANPSWDAGLGIPGTTYTNTSGKPLVLSIDFTWSNFTGSGKTVTHKITVNGIDTIVGSTGAWTRSSTLTSEYDASVALWTIVPPGAIYIAEPDFDGSYDFQWHQLSEGDQLDETENLLGVNQAWQDMRSQRTYNATYTNTTGRAIMISGGMQFLDIGKTLNAIVDGKSTLLAYSEVPNQYIPFTTVVPAGSTYRVDVAQAPNTLRWAELR